MNVQLIPRGPSGIRLRYQAGITGPQGDAGWSPVMSVVTDGSRRVLRITDWTGGEGAKPASGLYISATGTTANIALAVDIRGAQGYAGWSPELAVVADGARRVLRIVDWTGGAGTKPATGLYIAANGTTANVALAVDIRGPQGEEGPPAGPHTHPATEISDSTSVGRAVLTAASQSAARSAIGAAASSHTHPSSQITDFSEAVDDRVAALLTAGAGVAISYNDAAGTVTVSVPDALSSAAGQCRYEDPDGHGYRLMPYGGKYILVNGVPREIPAAGVAVSSGTGPYVYAYMNGATLALERSSTGHAYDATTGTEIKIGDAGRTLVGMHESTFTAISWYNRRPVTFFQAGLNGGSVGDGAQINRVDFPCWHRSQVEVFASWAHRTELAGNNSVPFLAFDASVGLRAFPMPTQFRAQPYVGASDADTIPQNASTLYRNFNSGEVKWIDIRAHTFGQFFMVEQASLRVTVWG